MASSTISFVTGLLNQLTLRFFAKFLEFFRDTLVVRHSWLSEICGGSFELTRKLKICHRVCHHYFAITRGSLEFCEIEKLSKLLIGSFG